MRTLIDRNKEHFALIRRTDKALTKLAIFVHGFRGNYWTTWGGLPHQLLEEADNHAVFEDWDYAFIGYDTRSVATYLDIAHLIWTEWRKAERGDPPYQHAYDRLALFGHSLGTLGLRQSLCASSKQPSSMLQCLHSVTYFGSPINGSRWATVAVIYEIADALKPGSPQLRMLKAWTETVQPLRTWPEVRVVLGQDDKVVGYESGELMAWAGDEHPPTMTHFDHSGLVKPNGWNTAVIDYIEAGLK